MDYRSQIRQNLIYIQTSLQNGTHKEQKAIIHLMMEDTLQAVKDTEFTYQYNYVRETDKSHQKVFINLANKSKTKLIASLEDLRCELTGRNGNSKQALALIKKMLETNLCKNEVKNKVRNWTNTTNITVKNGLIRTSV
ncbi:hypothetical protein DFO73_11638 [Cytobacillus oceanisediminis]|uniref:Uncharacterized protein n=1 Tax=Cytobacillus oceanisediminis TaxID=665099 RepID=A0A2V2ZKP3_9BACI|nr:hypothetical protein [Cytobacillus oceanisediminis]PWW20224.1 hypothetical protein DFO73_11638 [Cytobacillus oceanisediminis]